MERALCTGDLSWWCRFGPFGYSEKGSYHATAYKDFLYNRVATNTDGCDGRVSTNLWPFSHADVLLL